MDTPVYANGVRPQRPLRPGQIIAHALTGAWRLEEAPLEITADQLKMIIPGLHASGAAPLLWWRLRAADPATIPAAAELREAYLLRGSRAAIDERLLAWAVHTLQTAGIDPLLAKGWAVARYYPRPGLRPFGDHDLFVGVDRYARAKEVLAEAPDRPPYPGHIDLQRHPMELDDRPFQELRTRACVAPLADLVARVLGPEDQLRMTCLHLLRHEGRRPLWWCDIGAIVEATPDLDWDRVLRGSDRRAAWISCVLRLAHQLVGVRHDTLPPAVRDQIVPNWLAPAIYRRWEDGMASIPARSAVSYLCHPRGLRQGLYERWPNPLAATLNWGGYPDAAPRWPYQLRDVLSRCCFYGYRHLPPWRARFVRRQRDDAQDLVDRRRLFL